MHTGDGIERAEVTAVAPLTPDGGEGGSVLQALGSKEAKKQARVRRRAEKKQKYSEYLQSETWRKIRARVLIRDKNTCRACGKKAQVVHHRRYPKNLGEERLEWLYALCAPCHDEIHRRAVTMTLRHATDEVLGTPPRPRKKSRKKEKVSRSELESLQTHFARGVSGSMRSDDKTTKRRAGLTRNNQELHALQVRARENRERRKEQRQWHETTPSKP